jgi:hypothetical protein
MHVCTYWSLLDKCVHIRLLASVQKEGVQFGYNNTSTVKRGGVKKTFLWKTFEVYVTSCMSVSVPSLFEIFQTHLAL